MSRFPIPPSVARLTLVAAAAIALGACSGGDDENGASGAASVAAGDTVAVTSKGLVISYDHASPGAIKSSATLTSLATGDKLIGIDVRPSKGIVYGVGILGNVYQIDPNGTARLVIALKADTADTTAPYTALTGANFGVDFNPTVDRLRVVSDTGQNLRINVDTGAVTTDTDLNVGGATATGVTGVAYSNSFGTACRTTIYYIDSTNDRLLSSTSPNSGALTVVGSLGVDASAINSFDIQTASDGSNVGYAVFSDSAGNSKEYTVSLTTGAATPVGSVAAPTGDAVTGTASSTPATAPTQAPGEITAITQANEIVTFNRGTPARLCTAKGVTGVTNNLLSGIDTRPADGLLYALGSKGKIFTVNPSTGAAKLVSTLTADAADTTAPFTGLLGTTFGVDFNPTVDRLRVVSDTGQNLRINVDTGAVTTDADLNNAGTTATGVTEVGYTNSTIKPSTAATSTTLYYIDTKGDQLLTTTSPNTGAVTVVGALGVDVGTVTGFDIDGTSGTAILAAPINTAAVSTLYTVNLSSGAITALGTVGGGRVIAGLTFTYIAPATASSAVVAESIEESGSAE